MRWVMVAPTWLLMSSPTIGSLASVELRRPLGVAGDEHRDGVHERDAGVEARLRVEALRLLGADREVAHEHVGLACRAAPAATSTGSAGDSSMVSR